MSVRILIGDVRDRLAELDDESVHCVVTSPPYWGLRDYGVAGQIGLEPDFRDYIATLVAVFREVRRVLRADGTLWLNLGDSYAGSWGAQSREHAGKHAPNVSALSTNQVIAAQRRGSHTGSIPSGSLLKPKDLMLMPARVAIALQEDGWWVRRDIIWAKPNPMPESCTDRCTSAHEYLFHLSKSAHYYYNAAAIRETAETDDLRRPYGSQGAWDLYGRPAEQRHGGELRKVPAGWDTGPGDHRSGAGRYRQPNSPESIKSPHGQGFTRRAGHGEEPEDYDRLQARQDGLHGKIGRKGNAKGFRGVSYVGGKPGPRVEHGNQPNQTFSRNKRSVWTIATAPFGEAHFATFPPVLIEPCILAGCPAGGAVLDPFGGAGTTGLVADRLGRDVILIELNPDYAAMAKRRIDRDRGPLFVEAAE